MMLVFAALIAVTAVGVPRAAHRVPAGRGSGLRHRRRPAARRRVAGAHAARGRARSTRSSRDTPGVADWNTIGGNSVLDGATASNAATFYVVFKPWEERTDAEPQPGRDPRRPAPAARRRSRRRSRSSFPPPSIRGLGVAGGFQMQLEDRGGVGLPALQQMVAGDAARRQRRRAGSPRSTRPSAPACRSSSPTSTARR